MNMNKNSGSILRWHGNYQIIIYQTYTAKYNCSPATQDVKKNLQLIFTSSTTKEKFSYACNIYVVLRSFFFLDSLFATQLGFIFYFGTLYISSVCSESSSPSYFH